MPDKLTDKEIVKALECCITNNYGARECVECPLFSCDTCKSDLCKYVLDLINRLQAENERLQQTVEDKGGLILIDNAKAEAYKEFAERLKEKIIVEYNEYDEQEYPRARIKDIDNLLKEMVGEDNGKEKE